MISPIEDFINTYYSTFAKLFNVSDVELVKLYNADRYAGYPTTPGGSAWTSELKALYCFIRLARPKHILEIGNFLGTSGNHILQAVEDNKEGKVTLVDICDRLEYSKLHSTDFTRVVMDSIQFLSTTELTFDFYVQDGCHEYSHVLSELNLMTSRTQTSFNLWSHDYYSSAFGVTQALDEKRGVFSEFHPLKDSISDCGVVLSQYKKV